MTAAAQPARAATASGPRVPRHTLPHGAVDCHCHLFEDPARYPPAPGASYAPPRAGLDEYLAMCAAVGISRTVLVNASVYGLDSSVTRDAIAKVGQQRMLGICGIDPAAGAAELERLHRAGCRGVRLSTSVQGYGGIDALPAIAAKVRPFGWHIQLHLHRCDELVALEPALLACPVPLVFDHMARVRGSEGPAAPGFRALLRLTARRDDVWAKISSWYRLSKAGPPDYADMKPMAQALVAARPDRLVWGSNWPHPNWSGPMPDDANLAACLCAWVPDAAVRQRIFVDNPARLYGFGRPDR